MHVHSRVIFFRVYRSDFYSIFATVFSPYFLLYKWSVSSPTYPYTVSGRTSNWTSPFPFQHICLSMFLSCQILLLCWWVPAESSKYHWAPLYLLYVQYTVLRTEGVCFNASWTGYGVIVEEQEFCLPILQLCVLHHHPVWFSSEGHADSCSIRAHSVSWAHHTDTLWPGAGGVQTHAYTGTQKLSYSKFGS